MQSRARAHPLLHDPLGSRFPTRGRVPPPYRDSSGDVKVHPATPAIDNYYWVWYIRDRAEYHIQLCTEAGYVRLDGLGVNEA